jgi:hypothetical protein
MNERFATAPDLLGSDKPPEVRLAGVYAMAGLADDWEANRQTCVDVLCAYLLTPYEPDPGQDAPEPKRLAFQANRGGSHALESSSPASGGSMTSPSASSDRLPYSGHRIGSDPARPSDRPTALRLMPSCGHHEVHSPQDTPHRCHEVLALEELCTESGRSGHFRGTSWT